jgi:hypothetical protein
MILGDKPLIFEVVLSQRVEIKDGVMRIWDRHHRLLAKVTGCTNRLYVLNVQVAQPIYLAARWDDEAW